MSENDNRKADQCSEAKSAVRDCGANLTCVLHTLGSEVLAKGDSHFVSYK